MRSYSQDCPIARTMDLIGERWTVLIIRDLLMGHTKFQELRESSHIPPKVLSARLKMLMAEGIVERQVYSEHPLRAQYGLTDRGRTLIPVVLSIGKWGLDYAFDGQGELRDRVAEVIYDRIPEAREALVESGYVKGRAAAD